MAKVFLSYAHADEAFRDELVKHLTPLKRRGGISVWHDRRLLPGAPLDATISAELEAADLILMLISADFVASDYCWDKEMARALERHEAGEARAVSIVCRPCRFKDLPFARFVMTPTDAKAISTWTDRDAAWVDVVSAIERAIEADADRHDTPVHAAPMRTPGTPIRSPFPPAATPRPDRPRLPRVFTDLDLDQFQADARRTIADHFRRELAGLETTDATWKGVFEDMDATQFVARVYLHGREVATCHVFSGGGFIARGIFYSQTVSPGKNSWNECLTVEADADGPFLKAMGMAVGMGARDRSHLSPEAAAEYFFDLLIAQARSRIR